MIEPNTKYRTVKEFPSVKKGTIVVSPAADKIEAAKGKITPSMVQCSLPTGGHAYFFAPEDLEAV